MRQKNRRIMAAGIAAVTLCTSLVSAPVYAAEVSVLREYADELVTELIEFAVGTDSMRMVDAIQ